MKILWLASSLLLFSSASAFEARLSTSSSQGSTGATSIQLFAVKTITSSQVTQPEVLDETGQQEALKRGQDFARSILKPTFPIKGSQLGMRVMKGVFDIQTGKVKDVVVRVVTEPYWKDCIDQAERVNGLRYHVAAVGEPGVGKTMATAYLIRMPFYIESLREEESFYIVSPGTSKGNCAPPASFFSKVIIVTPPNDLYWGGKEFTRIRGDVKGRFVSLPSWTLPEVTEAREVLNAHANTYFTEQQVVRKFQTHGGIPGKIFVPTSTYSPQPPKKCSPKVTLKLNKPIAKGAPAVKGASKIIRTDSKGIFFADPKKNGPKSLVKGVLKEKNGKFAPAKTKPIKKVAQVKTAPRAKVEKPTLTTPARKKSIVKSTPVPEESKHLSIYLQTIPQIKEKLRAKDLKVSGNRGELIARLFDNMIVTEIKEELRSKKLPLYGKKAELIERHFEGMKLTELHEEARSRSLSTVGKKSELVQRLKESSIE